MDSAALGATLPSRCWWCRNQADSREHRYKKSDLVRIFGRGPYRGGDMPQRVGVGKPVDIQGPGSRQAQFERTLCSRCNNERSQPFDRAYDRFIGYLLSDRRRVLRRRRVDLHDAFGPAWAIESEALLRYYVKHIGCRIADLKAPHAIQVDPALGGFLDGGPFPASLQMRCSIDPDMVTMQRLLSHGGDSVPEDFLRLDPLWIWPVDTQGGPGLESGLYYSWFHVSWRVEPRQPLMRPWNGPIVDLPHVRTIEPRLRRALRIGLWRARLRLPSRPLLED